MNKRTFYFLEDVVTGLFYTGQNIWRSSFPKVAVYYSKSAAENKIKQLLNPKYAGSWTWNKIHAAISEQDIIQRENLPNWGIKIVEVIIST